MDFIFKWVTGKFKDYILKNWKTTLVGVVGSVCSQIPELAPYKEQILAATVALVALFSKDGDKSGTTDRPRSPPEVVAEQLRMVETQDATVLNYTGGG